MESEEEQGEEEDTVYDVDELEGDESGDESRDESREGEDNEFQGNENTVCDNCNRKQMLSEGDDLKLKFRKRNSNEIARRRKFKNVTYSQANIVAFILCEQRHSHLTLPDPKVYNSLGSNWPSFFWRLLTNKKVQMTNKDRAWRFIPSEWRHWWLKTLKVVDPMVYRHISLTHPSPVIKDRSREMDIWEMKMKS